MSHQPRAGRHSHTLKPAVEHPEDTQCQHRGAEPEQQVADAAENKSRHEEITCIAAVAPDAVEEFRKPVDQSVKCEEQPEVGFRDAHFLIEVGHGDAQILAHEIEERITEDAHRNGPEFPVFETFELFRTHAGIGRILRFSCHGTYRIVLFEDGAAVPCGILQVVNLFA